MICKLGVVQRRAELLWRPCPGVIAWLQTPYQIPILKNVKIQEQQKYLPRPLLRAKVLRHKSFTSSENTNSAKSCPSLLPRYLTIVRHLDDVHSDNFLYYFDLFNNNWKRRINLWLHYCKLCNRLFLNQRIGSSQHRAKFPILVLASIHVEAFHNTMLLWLTKEFFLPDITTYRHRRNWTT